MKILNKEDEQPVIYIQQKNIRTLIQFEEHVPKSIQELATKLNVFAKDQIGDEEFVRITNKKDIEYLSTIEWIPEYRDLRDITILELTNLISKHIQKIKDLRELYSSKEKPSDKYIQREYEKTNATIKDINAYIWTKQGKYDTPITIPLVLDRHSPYIESNKNFRFGFSLDNKHILIERKNGKKFGQDFVIDPIEVQSGILIFMGELGMIPKTITELDITIKSEATNKYLVADHAFEIDKTKAAVEDRENHKPTRINPTQKKKSIFNKVFNPKQKDEN